MKKCKYIGPGFVLFDSIVSELKTGEYFYYYVNYSFNKTNPWYQIYNLNQRNITTFSRGEFGDMFIDLSDERKEKLKKINESNL